MLSESRCSAQNLLAMRRAAIVAAASIGSKIRNTRFSEEYALWAKEKIELDACVLDCELKFLDALACMDHEERVLTVFEMFDRDGGGYIDISELAEGLRRMSQLKAVSGIWSLAEATLSEFDVKTTGVLDNEEFVPFLENLENSLHCESFLDLCQLLCMRVAFSETSRCILQDSMTELMGNATDVSSDDSRVDDTIIEARMILLFLVLDRDQSGMVLFKDVVKHLFRFSLGMDQNKRDVLLLVDEDHLRRLDYVQFSDFLTNAVGAMPPGQTIHDLADSMTLSAVRKDVSDRDLESLLAKDSSFSQGKLSNRRATLSDLHYGRLERLFELFDVDHDGAIDLTELALGMRKFTETHKDLDSSIADSHKAIRIFDEDSDERLSIGEFANMLTRFADSSGIDLHQLIDFMVVQAAVRDDVRQDQAYLRFLDVCKRKGSIFKPTNRPGMQRITIASIVQKLKKQDIQTYTT